jgi:hypothetical protein
MRRGRALLLRLSIALASTLVALVLAEGVVRVFFPHVRDRVLPGRLIEIDQRLGWRLRPGAASVHASRYFRVEYAINDLGFRDPPRRLEKARGVHRSLLYGDSQAFGWGVAEERRFSNLVEARVEGLEIWNLGVPGYGLDQELLWWEQSGDRFGADEVLLLITTDTLSRLRYGRIYRKDKPRFELDSTGRARLVPIRGGQNALTGIAYEALSGFYLPYFVEQRLPGARWVPAAGSPASELAALELAILERARALAKASGVPLTLLISLPPSEEPTRRGIESFATANGVGCLEIDVPSDDERYVLGSEDLHWNQAANALIAEQLATAFAASAARQARTASR